MDIQETTGTTFVIVTHDQEEAMTVSSRVAVMDHGKIVQVDTPDRIYEEPNSVYVADFLGDVNIIRGKATRADADHVHIHFAEGQSPLWAATKRDLAEGTEVALAIRPEKVTITSDKPADRNNTIRGKCMTLPTSATSQPITSSCPMADHQGPDRQHPPGGTTQLYLGRRGLAELHGHGRCRAGGLMRRFALISVPPYAWLLALFLVPFLIVLKISLSDIELSIPPYTPQLDLSKGWEGLTDWASQLDLENFWFLAEDSLYWKAYLSSLKIAIVSTIMTLIVGYPIAYAMTRAPDEWRPTLMMLVILPFWTSFLIRVYAWKAILSQEGGLLNQLLMGIGVLNEPLTILNTNTAVYIGIVYTYLPFMVLPIYAALERLDESLLEAAEDLGCSRFTAFWLVTLPPLSKQGIIAGSFLVFIPPAMGEFVIPALLGGSETLMIGKVLWEEFFSNRDWPVASAVAVILLLLLIIPIVLFQRNEEKQREAGK